MQKALIVINSKNIRGIITPAADLSREILEDIIDLIDWSSKKEARKAAVRLKNGDRAKSWVPLSTIRRRRA